MFRHIERVTHDVTDPVASLFDSISGGPSAQNTIAALQQQNAELRTYMSRCSAAASDVNRFPILSWKPRCSRRKQANP